MKLSFLNRRSHGFTLLEAVFVTFLLFMLAIVLLPALLASHVKRDRINCLSHLKQIGISFRIWEGDHNDKHPMQASVTNRWMLEHASQVNAETIFQMMSNELSSPIILVCPADKNCRPAPNFKAPLTSSNISYFINMDASEVNPQDILSGDDNFEIGGVPVKSGLLEISSNTPIAWSASRHRFSANVAMADGSVQGANNGTLIYWLRSTNFTSIHLTIP